MMLRFIFLLSLCALDAPIRAQTDKQLPARRFHFDNYRSVLVIDMKALRDTGVWDEFSVSPMKATVRMIEDQFGFELDEVEELTTQGVVADTSSDRTEHRQ